MTVSRQNARQFVFAQGMGQAIREVNLARDEALAHALRGQDQAFLRALSELNVLRDQVASPGAILGNPLTKHGEVAEYLEVASQRAWSRLYQQAPTATFDGVGRLAPFDYLMDGTPVQSKFINGTNNGLRHILEHKAIHPTFGQHGEYYHLPEDQYRQIQEVIGAKSHDRLAGRTIRAIKENVEAIERTFGRDFQDVVRPGNADYGEVQLGKIDETIHGREDALAREQEKELASIRGRDEYHASFTEGAQIVGGGILFGGLMGGGMEIYRKRKSGQHLWDGDYTTEDWKDVGAAAAEGGATSGVIAGGTYALTNLTATPAPVAASGIASAIQLGRIAYQHRAGRLDLDEAVGQSHVVALNATTTAAGALIGQTLIPIPIVGALAGTAAAQGLSSLGQRHLAKREQAFLRRLDADFRRTEAATQRRHKQRMFRLNIEMEWHNAVADRAFATDQSAGEALASSVDLARAHEVSEESIVTSTDDVDAFMGVPSTAPSTDRA